MPDQHQIAQQPIERPGAVTREPSAPGRPAAENLREDEQPRRQDREAGKSATTSDTGGKSDPPKRRSATPKIILGVLIVGGIIAGVYYWLSTRGTVSTDDAFTDGRAITVAPQISGVVVNLAVNDNQRVRAGDLLIEIDPRPFVASRDQAAGNLAIAQAQLDNARLNLETARVDNPAKLASAQAQLGSARANQINAESNYKRQHGVARGATTQQDIDQSTASLQAAQAQVDQAQAQVRQADLVPQLIAQADAQVKQWEGQVTQARAQLDQAELNLSWSRVVAPQDGWITRRNVERGNYVQAGQSLFSIVTPEVWVTANFKETQLDGLKPGQHVAISVDAHPELDLRGHIDSVQLGSGSKFTAFPAENATGNFVKIVQRVPVKIVIDSGLDADRPLPLGLSVVPTVTVP